MGLLAHQKRRARGVARLDLEHSVSDSLVAENRAQRRQLRGAASAAHQLQPEVAAAAAATAGNRRQRVERPQQCTAATAATAAALDEAKGPGRCALGSPDAVESSADAAGAKLQSAVDKRRQQVSVASTADEADDDDKQ